MAILSYYMEVEKSNEIYLKLCKLMVEISTLSISIRPADRGTVRKSAANKELLPAPVRPTTPIFSAGRVSKVTPLRDASRCSLSTKCKINRTSLLMRQTLVQMYGKGLFL